MDSGTLSGPSLKADLILGAGITHYYVIMKRKYMDFYRFAAEQVSPELKSVRLL
jgi:hypothetical protein